MKHLAAITFFSLLAIAYTEETIATQSNGLIEKMLPYIRHNNKITDASEFSFTRKNHLSESNKLSLALFFLKDYLCSGALLTIRHVLTVTECFSLFENDTEMVKIYVRVNVYITDVKYKYYGHVSAGDDNFVQLIMLDREVCLVPNEPPMTLVSRAPALNESQAVAVEWYKPSCTVEDYVVQPYSDEKYIYIAKNSKIKEHIADNLGGLLFVNYQLVGISQGLVDPHLKMDQLTPDHEIRYLQIADYVTRIDEIVGYLSSHQLSLLTKPVYYTPPSDARYTSINGGM